MPVETIARDYFGVDKGGMPRFLRKLGSGEIPLPVMRMKKSQKGARLISLQDLPHFSTSGAPTHRKNCSS